MASPGCWTAATCHARRARSGRGTMKPPKSSPMSQQAPALLRIGYGNPAEPAAVDTWNPIVPGQPFVEVGVVGRQKIQNASVLAERAADKEFRLLA